MFCFAEAPWCHFCFVCKSSCRWYRASPSWLLMGFMERYLITLWYSQAVTLNLKSVYCVYLLRFHWVLTLRRSIIFDWNLLNEVFAVWNPLIPSNQMKLKVLCWQLPKKLLDQGWFMWNQLGLIFGRCVSTFLPLPHPKNSKESSSLSKKWGDKIYGSWCKKSIFLFNHLYIDMFTDQTVLGTPREELAPGEFLSNFTPLRAFFLSSFTQPTETL